MAALEGVRVGVAACDAESLNMLEADAEAPVDGEAECVSFPAVVAFRGELVTVKAPDPAAGDGVRELVVAAETVDPMLAVEL